MANIKEAIEYAKKNPTTPFATELRKRIESGQMNKELQDVGITPPNPEAEPEKPTLGARIKEGFEDFTGIRKDIAESAQKRADNIAEIKDAMNRGEQGKLRSMLQTIGQLAGSGADAIGAVGKGAVNLFLSDKSEKAISKFIGEKAGEVMATPEVQSIIGWYNSLPPEQQRDLDAAGGVVSLVTNFVGGGAIGKAGSTTSKAVKAGTTATADAISTAAKVTKEGIETGLETAAKSGIVQKGKELVQRVPRAVQRGKESVAAASERAARIKASEPVVADAIKARLDDRIINTVTQADEATAQAYKEVLDIAEEAPKTIGMKKQPTIVGGELAAEQYDLIVKQKQAVGKELSEAVAQLSKDTKVNINPAVQSVDDVLNSNGIKVMHGDDGLSIDFSGSNFTNAERARIQELYKLATEAGGEVTPLEVYKKNQLFSKLQREAKFEGLGDILVDTPEGKKNLFSVFRDVYAKTLDDVSPENIRAINKKYAELSNLTDDIEDSIFKAPDFQVVKGLDPAEIAKINLRRIFGESASSPVFEKVADVMDSAARGLGYQGATPKAVAEFAQEMRKLFPDTIPKTGFSGGIRTSLTGIAEDVMNAGAPGLKDQQEALRKLLESLTAKK